MGEHDAGVDLSGLHRELDRLKVSLCRCQHQGTCLACRGFEVLREQSQMVAAAASQPVLMQVAQEAAMNDLMGQLGGVQSKLAGDTELQEMMMRMMERVQEDLGGPDELARLMSGLGLSPRGGPGGAGPQPRAPEDRPGFGGPRSQPPDAQPPADQGPAPRPGTGEGEGPGTPGERSPDG